MSSRDVVTVTDEELAAHLEAATREVRSFVFRAPARPKAPSSDVELGGRRIQMRPLQSAEQLALEQEFSLAQRIRDIEPRDELYTDIEHRVVRRIRRAVQVYFKIYEYYENASGLARLKDDNRRGRLRASSEPELGEKVEAGSAASLFSFAAFLLATVSRGTEGAFFCPPRTN